MMEKSGKSVISIGFSTMLFFIFLVLKLTGYIDWSCCYVTMPLWIVWAVIIGIAVVIIMIGGTYVATQDKTIPKPRPKPKSRFQARL